MSGVKAATENLVVEDDMESRAAKMATIDARCSVGWRFMVYVVVVDVAVR